MRVELHLFKYKYMEYEKDLLMRGLMSLFPKAYIEAKKDHIILDNMTEMDLDKCRRLSYISHYTVNNSQEKKTLQHELEYCNDQALIKKQGTRYSTHGLHEYKGKFNPQIVRGILELFGIEEGAKVLDPFCGSGTTMLECIHYDIDSLGMDINPLAVLISNVKIQSLNMDVEYVKKLVEGIKEDEKHYTNDVKADDLRMEYLLRWIPEETLALMETLRERFEKEESVISDFLKVTVSDLIRDYSNQEPSDLRIRRRFTPFPEEGFIEKWKDNVYKYLELIKSTQKVKKYDTTRGRAILVDIREVNLCCERKFDAIITSPPYATALPYIDTQRISLVWLGLCTPSEIKKMEASLIGSREMAKNEKEYWKQEFESNNVCLPNNIMSLIVTLFDSISEGDGFRKKAVPILLYRYFCDMKKMFCNTLNMIKDKGYYGLIVGNNKTTLGGKTFVIDTPAHLACIAEHSGWKVQELIPLQTYKRYGIHQKNSINEETLIILTKV